MKIGIIRERNIGENRVAATPETVKKYIQLDAEVIIETGAGEASHISDAEYTEAGARIEKDAAKVISDSDILIKVQGSTKKGVSEIDEISHLKKGAIFVALLNPYQNAEHIQKISSQGVTSFAMELMPRITRAQSMDTLSSQSNLAGYKAVIDAVAEFGKVVPMMMTAAGTIAPAKVLVLGAGVAGLQAIATAKRLGAVVSAFDVRPIVKEQVESLGANFIEVPVESESGEDAGGYAKEMSDDYKRKQQELIDHNAKKSDIIITTALIPGRPAPVLIPEDIVKHMKPGSIIVDLAAIAGGNCPLSRPGEVVEQHGVKIIGYDNLPSRVAIDASKLYAKNIFNFVSLLIDKEKKNIAINQDDEIIKATMVTHNGHIVNEKLKK